MHSAIYENYLDGVSLPWVYVHSTICETALL